MESETAQTKFVPVGRNSGIDLLRIIAMCCICIFHASKTARGMVDVDALGLVSKTASYLLNQLGQIGNILFVICSSYYLVDGSRSKSEKALGILFDSSVISLCVLIGYLVAGYMLPWDEILHNIFPDIFGQLWFIPCYVVFYLFAPIVGKGLKKLGKKVHLVYCLAMLVLYGGLSFIGLNPVGSELLCFFFYFGLVAFEKWYMAVMFKKLLGARKG